MAEITKSGVANLGSQEDLKNVKAALEADGVLTVVDDPEPETETVVNDEGEEEEQVVQAGATIGPVPITVENTGEEEEPVAEPA